jgi:hypothetical protein
MSEMLLRLGFFQDGDVGVGVFGAAMVAATLARRFRKC